MEIQEEPTDKFLKINLSGRMDIDGVGNISDKFADLVKNGALSIIIDMSKVPYICSFGIRSLLINAKTVNNRGGKYVLLSPQPDVKNVLQVSGIDQIIAVCDSMDDALKKVSI
ncbi:MAG: STAS domain-containing protein [Neptuniibacter sp.]